MTGIIYISKSATAWTILITLFFCNLLTFSFVDSSWHTPKKKRLMNIQLISYFLLPVGFRRVERLSERKQGREELKKIKFYIRICLLVFLQNPL